MVNTIAQLKQVLTQRFNDLITDKSIQDYFSSVCDLWGKEPTYYNNSDDKILGGIVYKYSRHIQAELNKTNAINIDGSTKVVTTAGLENTGQTQNNGQFKTSSIIYPDGYTGTTDKSFLKGDTLESEFTQATDTNNNKEETIEETDNLAKAQLIISNNITPRITSWCDKLVFSLIKVVF